MMNETDSEFSEEIDSSSSDESSSDEEDQPSTSTNIERGRGRGAYAPGAGFTVEHPRRVGRNGNRFSSILFYQNLVALQGLLILSQTASKIVSIYSLLTS